MPRRFARPLPREWTALASSVNFMHSPPMALADDVAIELAQLQVGSFARWQLRPRGVSDDAIAARLRNRRWLQARPGVYVLAGIAESMAQRLWVGWLAVGPDALVSHEAAAEMHRIPNVLRGRVTLISPHGWHHRLQGVTVR